MCASCVYRFDLSTADRCCCCCAFFFPYVRFSLRREYNSPLKQESRIERKRRRKKRYLFLCVADENDKTPPFFARSNLIGREKIEGDGERAKESEREREVANMKRMGGNKCRVCGASNSLIIALFIQ